MKKFNKMNEKALSQTNGGIIFGILATVIGGSIALGGGIYGGMKTSGQK